MVTHPGAYGLRTSMAEWDEEALWRTYTALTDVEAVFRSLKSELGLRPIFHRTPKRSDGHLFITVIAYQLVQSIRRHLGEKGERARWSTLLSILEGHQRVTATFHRKDGRTLHVRKATRFAREKDREVPASLVARISRPWDRIPDDAIAFHEARPPLKTGKRGRPSRRVGHNLALRLQKHKRGCLRFLSDPRVPFTNNGAERDLRMAKLRQKISGGLRSEDGASHFATPRAVINTARKQDWNVLQTLAHPDPIQLIPTLRL